MTDDTNTQEAELKLTIHTERDRERERVHLLSLKPGLLRKAGEKKKENINTNVFHSGAKTNGLNVHIQETE